MTDDQYSQLFRYMETQFGALRDENAETFSRLDRIESRVGALEGRMDQIDERFERVDKRLDELDKRFDEVIESQNEILNAVGERLDKHDRQIQQIAGHIGLELAA